MKGGRPKKSENGKVGSEFKILHTNIRGISSKKDSLIAVINSVQPSCITINETGLRGNNKVKEEVLSKWIRFKKDLDEIKARGNHTS